MDGASATLHPPAKKLPSILSCLQQSKHLVDILLAEGDMLIIDDNTWNTLDLVLVDNVLLF